MMPYLSGMSTSIFTFPSLNAGPSRRFLVLLDELFFLIRDVEVLHLQAWECLISNLSDVDSPEINRTLV